MADASFDDILLLLPGIGVNDSTNIYDYGPDNRTPENTNSVKTVTASNTYGSAISFSSTSRLKYATSLDFGLGQDDFTLQFRIKFTADASGTDALFDFRSSATANPWALSLKNTGTGTNILRMYYATGTTYAEWDAVLAPNTEYHIALSGAADGSSLKLFADGVEATLSAGALPNASLGASNAVTIGTAVDGTTGYTGLMWDIELTKGVARYTTGFTPPATLCLAITGAAKIGSTAAHEVQAYPAAYPSGLHLPTATPESSGSYTLYTSNIKQTLVCHHDDPTGTVMNTPEAAVVEPGGTQNFYGVPNGNVGGINSILLSTL